MVFIEECVAVDLIAPLPADGIIGVSFLDIDRKRIPVMGKGGGEVIGRVEDPGVAGFGGKKDQWPDAYDATIVLGSALLDRADLLSETEILPR